MDDDEQEIPVGELTVRPLGAGDVEIEEEPEDAEPTLPE
jgi:hypothetical protein